MPSGWLPSSWSSCGSSSYDNGATRLAAIFHPERSCILRGPYPHQLTLNCALDHCVGRQYSPKYSPVVEALGAFFKERTSRRCLMVHTRVRRFIVVVAGLLALTVISASASTTIWGGTTNYLGYYID